MAPWDLDETLEARSEHSELGQEAAASGEAPTALSGASVDEDAYFYADDDDDEDDDDDDDEDDDEDEDDDDEDDDEDEDEEADEYFAGDDD